MVPDEAAKPTMPYQRCSVFQSRRRCRVVKVSGSTTKVDCGLAPRRATVPADSTPPLLVPLVKPLMLRVLPWPASICGLAVLVSKPTKDSTSSQVWW